jgi:hypothetical protein
MISLGWKDVISHKRTTTRRLRDVLAENACFSREISVQAAIPTKKHSVYRGEQREYYVFSEISYY